MDRRQPIAGIGAVVIHDEQVLLVKRLKPPKQGLWCIPGGKIRFGETLQQAAEREIKEETAVIIKAGAPVHVFDLIEAPDFHFIVIDVLAEYISGTPRAGDDAGDAKWFSLKNLELPDMDTETKLLLGRIIRQRRDLIQGQ